MLPAHICLATCLIFQVCLSSSKQRNNYKWWLVWIIWSLLFTPLFPLLLSYEEEAVLLFQIYKIFWHFTWLTMNHAFLFFFIKIFVNQIPEWNWAYSHKDEDYTLHLQLQDFVFLCISGLSLLTYFVSKFTFSYTKFYFNMDSGMGSGTGKLHQGNS